MHDRVRSSIASKSMSYANLALDEVHMCVVRLTSNAFLRAYISRTKFSNLFLRAYISHTKSQIYFVYNGLCTEDDVYKLFVHIFVRKLVTDV